ncbi:lamin tail domain-containing protein [Leucobacter allii]|uniref:lamin tail domain-containing protein n=1 Tax=Leucobacter allii TaxID=2932247 RepID=UPI001FD176D0|nr:lamin tail domain-containing protein [Leucobacter allii]UOR01009.1 lamin tail domain-containing protein [Leucobacter allii]
MSRKQGAAVALAMGAVAAIGISGAVGVAAPTPAAAAVDGLRISEIESSGGVPGDWIEFANTGEAPVDLSGFTVRDDDDAHGYAFPAGSTLAPGGYLVIDELQRTGEGDFDFGLGGADAVRLFDPSGALVDAYAWTAHAATTYGVDGDGAWAETEAPTKGEGNRFAAEPEAPTSALRLNEIDSSPGDWVELVNLGDAELSLDGYELRDNSDDHRWAFPAGATIASGGFLVVDEASIGVVDGAPGSFAAAIGIGSADRIRLFDAGGALIDDSGPWEGHAEIGGDPAQATLARCPDGAGEFVLAHPTPGAANSCADPGEGGEEPEPIVTETWPGAPETRELDAAQMFLEDSSGLDAQTGDDGVLLWAVDNGTGTFWKLTAEADGSVAFADGWESGKRARFAKDAGDPAAAGPDTEGITVAGDGMLYLASERDNGAKAVNFNSVLQIDPEAEGPDVVASQEWDLTAQLPQVSANLGIEAVEWVADDELRGRLVDERTGAGYDPADYPLHGEGLFFVAVEDGGRVFAFALNSDGTAEQVADVTPGLPGVMALDYDAVRGGLWAACDDGCAGASAFIAFGAADGAGAEAVGGAGATAGSAAAAAPSVTLFARPEGLPLANTEGFATAPAGFVVDGRRPAWWFTDGVQTGALRAGWLDAADEVPGGGADSDADGAGAAVGTGSAEGTASGSAGAGGAGGGAASGGAGSSAANGTADASVRATAQSATLAQTGWGANEFLLLVVVLLGAMGAVVLLVSRRRGSAE